MWRGRLVCHKGQLDVVDDTIDRREICDEGDERSKIIKFFYSPKRCG